MQGITNAPQGGSSEGTWTLRASDNDWTDMFEKVNTQIKAKKNIIFMNNNGGYSYIPKGLIDNSIMIRTNSLSANNGVLTFSKYCSIAPNQLTSSILTQYIQNLTFTSTANGSPVNISSSNMNATISKSSFTIYTSD